MQPFEIIDHTADVAIVAHGATRQELFANAARAMFAIIAEPRSVAPRQTRQLHIEAADPQALLADFLAELLYLFDGELFVLHHAELTALTDRAVDAVLHGEPVAPHHVFNTEIKAVTHHNLSVEQTEDGWRATVLFDI